MDNAKKNYFKLHATHDEARQTFRYYDEYGWERYYTVRTYLGDHVGSIKPFEAIGFISTAQGAPIGDPWNDCEVMLSGTDQMAVQYAAIYEMHYKSHYWWDPACHPEAQDE